MTYLAFGIALLLAAALYRSHRRRQEDARHWEERERKFLERDRTRSKRHRREIRRLLDALPDPFFSIGATRKIIRHNTPAAEIFKGRDLEDRSIQQVFLDTSLIEMIDEAITTGAPLSDTLHLSPNSPFSAPQKGKTSHWNVEINPVSLRTDHVEIQLLMRDITASIVADQVRQDFVANASHELRTPLSIISGYLENLTEAGGLDHRPMVEKMLATMSRHVDRINRIVEDMLVISRLESDDSAPLKREEFSLADCVNDIVERLDPVIRKQGAAVQIDVADLVLSGDVFYWTQLLFNLVENALKQNATSPVRVRIAARRNDDGGTTITVNDNGIGIPRNDLPFIFKRFYRVEKHHSQNQVKGTGLGLSIVKRAVEAHGGTIAATSTPGVETAFIISLPAT